ncbi:hypothetical protein SB768_28850 [Burkholderia sp. SIMBA_043]|uniref:hypothetical protein n=1 Tax=Burkholderia TaxID=32008 RepID=UPI0005D7C419|nr:MULTISPECIES: hypothetical protein [Burkholderia cepacia complex]AJY07970.1 hypothetical protein AK36_2461 [Burkholderia vietnamiensis LMG 10929]UBI28087.1 hypothetical protein LA325_13235 [Burkholderia vietnamiensis]
MKKRFIDEQVIRILREAESRDEPVKDLRKHRGISKLPANTRDIRDVTRRAVSVVARS